MSSQILYTLIKLLVPAITVFVLLFVSRKRGIVWSADLGLQGTKPRWFLSWLVIWITWTTLSEFVLQKLGLQQIPRWADYPIFIIIIRILAIGILGPISEEILIRGLVFYKLCQTVVGVIGAIIITSILWSAMHLQYEIITLVQIFIDGIILGVARHHSKSLWTSIAMHITGNLISIAQSMLL